MPSSFENNGCDHKHETHPEDRRENGAKNQRKKQNGHCNGNDSEAGEQELEAPPEAEWDRLLVWTGSVGKNDLETAFHASSLYAGPLSLSQRNIPGLKSTLML